MTSDISPALSAPVGGAAGASAETLAAVARLVQLYEQLTPQHLDSLHLCYAAEAHFKDPFNDVYGIVSIRQVFAHMFATLEAPRFAVTEQLVQGQQAFLAWEFHFRLRRWRAGQPQCIRGGSLLRFDAQGLVQEHRDYWDTAEELYEKLPVLGVLMRGLRRAGAAPQAQS
ncbi:nuclear transport factor 2 family protein [Comamonas aquatica]|uniref:nuclear transport factor 2 family protein n=1 Tax=Comamonas aquatica TaxID=225991 RepID=UPI0034D7BA8F